MILNLTKRQVKVLDKVLYESNTGKNLEFGDSVIFSEIRIKFGKSAKKAKINL